LSPSRHPRSPPRARARPGRHPRRPRPRPRRPTLRARRQNRQDRQKVPRKRKEPRPRAGLPSKDAILDFVRGAPGKVGKREIARAFRIEGGDRPALKRMLAEMTEAGLISGNRKTFKERGQLPAVTVLEIVSRDADGELIAEPVVWDQAEGEKPRALLSLPARARSSGGPALGQGDRILARLTRLEESDAAGCRYEAEPLKRLPRGKRRQL